jgi:hypothetical protein
VRPLRVAAFGRKTPSKIPGTVCGALPRRRYVGIRDAALECADVSALWFDATCRVEGKRCHAIALHNSNGMDSFAPAHSALAGLWLCQMEFPLLLMVAQNKQLLLRNQQTFRRFPNGSSAILQPSRCASTTLGSRPKPFINSERVESFRRSFDETPSGF